MVVVCFMSVGCDDMQMIDITGTDDIELPIKYLALYDESDDALTPINNSEEWSRYNESWEKLKGEEAPLRPGFAVEWDTDLFDHWFYLRTVEYSDNRLIYDLGEHSFGKFECSVFLPNFCDGLASINVKWFANNIEVYDSGVINTEVVLNLTFELPIGTRFLKLQVSDTGDDDKCNHFVIGNPRLITVDPIVLMPEPVMQISEGYISFNSESPEAMLAINDIDEWNPQGTGIWEKTKEQEDSPNPGDFVDWDTELFDHWFYSHGPSRMVFDLRGQNFTYFECSSRLPNSCGGVASMEFIWFADDVEIYNSGVVRAVKGERMSFDIPVGTKMLTLEVTDGGDSDACDHYIIGNSRLLTEKPDTTMVDMYFTLPEISLSTELESGKYRISPTYVYDWDHKIIRLEKVIGDERTDEIRVRIVLNPQPWFVTAEGRRVIGGNPYAYDEIVVEVKEKIDVLEEQKGRFTLTRHVYEGVALFNLTRPNHLFEYETVEEPENETVESTAYLAILTETDEAILPSNDPSEWRGWGDSTWGETIDGERSSRPSGFAETPPVEDFDHWFYSHAESLFVYEFGGNEYSHFNCSAVLVSQGSVEIIWLADDEEVYNSGVLSDKDVIHQIEFEIPAGTQTLKLQVTDGGDGITHDHYIIGNPKLRLEISSPPKMHVFIDPAEIRSPAVGQQFSVPIKIANGKNVKGYKFNIGFDPTALKFISIVNADYLPGAILLPREFEGSIELTAVVLNAVADDSNGTLATITFEVLEVKPSDIQLSDVIITNNSNERIDATTADAKVIVNSP